MEENQLRDLMLWVARVVGIGGVLVCVVAVIARLSGEFAMFGFQTFTVLQASSAMMLVGCVSYLALITRMLRTQ